MKYYNVNGVLFSFVNQFDTYYKDNLEKYEMEPIDVKHHIETILVKEIPFPKDSPEFVFQNRYIYNCEHDETIVIVKDDIPILLIEKAHDYSTIYLYLRSDLEGIEEVEYVYHGIIFMELCLYYSIQSLHGSAIKVNNKAVIFSAPSGTGKSTHVNYWKKLEDSIDIINDDKPLIYFKNDTIFVAGSPWSGKTKDNQNISVPLQAIVFLKQGETNDVKTLNKQQKTVHIMRNINRPRQNHLWDKVKCVLEELIERIPMYEATVTNSIEAAVTVKEKIGA